MKAYKMLLYCVIQNRFYTLGEITWLEEIVCSHYLDSQHFSADFNGIYFSVHMHKSKLLTIFINCLKHKEVLQRKVGVACPC